METTQVGKLVKRLRRQKGYTQEELARRAVVSISTVSRLEQGRTQKSRDLELDRIAHALGVSPDLLRDTGEGEQGPAWVASDARDGLRDVDVRVLAEALIQLAEADERDLPIIREGMARIKGMIDAVREAERSRRRIE